MGFTELFTNSHTVLCIEGMDYEQNESKFMNNITDLSLYIKGLKLDREHISQKIDHALDIYVAKGATLLDVAKLDKYKAIKMYRELHNCGIKEAHSAITEMLSE